MSQLLKVRFPDGRVLQPGDWTTAEPLWSTVEVAAGSFTQLVAFSYGLGQAVPGSPSQRSATLADTNLQGEGGRLPENEALQISAIGLELYSVPAAGQTLYTDDSNVTSPDIGVLNLMRLQRDLIMTVQIASVKEYLRVPIAFAAAASGPHSDTASGLGADLANGYVAATNGSTSIKGLRQLASPLVVMGGEALRVTFIAPTGTVTGLSFTGPGTTGGRIRMRTTLYGYHKRPVA